MSRRNFLKQSLAGVAGLSLPSVFGATAARAEGFPEKPIRVVVPFKPGGRTDAVARLLAETIQEKALLPQPMVIVNADGGAGSNGVQQMKRGGDDGYTIMHWSHQMLIAEAMQIASFGMDDFRSIGFTGGGSPVWCVREDSPFETLEDLVTELKANPQSLIEAVGIGSVPHFVGAMLANAAGFETRLVTANSGADRLRLLLGGSADIALFAAQEYMAQGEGLRPLVYFGEERLSQLPDLPTATELGYDVTWSNPNWWLAPAGTPDEAVAAIGAALEEAMKDPAILEYFEGNTLAPYWTGSEDSEAQSREMLARLKDVAATIQ
ncbi:tripartite tricarboxylate transporter substrate binding protein [Salipiger sp. PrR002]|uniref:Bug family tripartite tricarboxylate transporter substrate binding protein n=1 Tax=Salipiger sp. PrR002 TaxID=2706489 RepID=UPI0013BC00A3|nr:tripartite tricarboxylate transporter substrate binding protein [Salipiger sp. PrR002]NDW01748.1 tripartite tricarboxylate transporter substrate binding protein [Salipiger sp. PrR002]NDW57815.1 tripartite tricarboxylate transporter substrate binding protein [Salipiger sp. PrR004]